MNDEPSRANIVASLEALTRITQAWLERRVFVIFALWALWLAVHYGFLGPWSYVSLVDEGDVRVPINLAFNSWLFDLAPRLWAPAAVAGVDTLASAIKPNLDGLLYTVFPGWLAYALGHWVVRLVAGYFMFRLLHERLGVSWWIALAVGFAVALYQASEVYPNTQMMAVGIFLLWVFPWAEGRRWLGIAAVFALGFLFGSLSIYAFSAFFMPAIGLIALALWPCMRTVWLFTACCCGLLLSDGQSLAAGIMNAAESQRLLTHGVTIERIFGSAVWQFDQWALYAVVPILAWFATGLRDRRLLLVALAVLVPLVLPFSYYLALKAGLIGASGSGVTVRFFKGMPVVAAIGFGLGADAILTRTKLLWRRRLTVAVVSAGLAVMVGLSVQQKMIAGWNFLHGSSYDFLYRHKDMMALSRATAGAPPFRVVTVPGFRVGFRQEPAFAWVYGFETADGYVHLYSRRYYRFWEAVNARIRKVNLERHGRLIKPTQAVYLYSLDGMTWEMCAPRSIYMCDMRAAAYYNLDLLSLANVRFIISPVALSGPGLRLLPSANRDRLVSLQHLAISQKWRAVLRGEQALATTLYIYENDRVLPRFFLAEGIKVLDSEEAVLSYMQDSSVESLRRFAALSRGDLPLLGTDAQALSKGGGGAVTVRRYDSDVIVLDVEARARSLLVVTNNYSPYWRACMNGRRLPVVPAYHTFQGIPVTPGRHVVTLEYVPPYRLRPPTICGAESGAGGKKS